VVAHKHAGAYPILGEVYGKEASYVSRIFVRKDSGIKSLAELRGKTIAFTDPLSSSGYLYPLDLFMSKGLVKKKPEEFFKRMYFAGGDEQAIRAVLNNFTDSAGIGQFAYGLLRPDERDALVHIGESRRLPSHCIVVRKDLNAKMATAVQDAFFALNDGPNKGLLENLYGVDGYVKVTHKNFKEVEDVAREHGFIKAE
jgi:phosphonate transport system substrate-binding protein